MHNFLNVMHTQQCIMVMEQVTQLSNKQNKSFNLIISMVNVNLDLRSRF